MSAQILNGKLLAQTLRQTMAQQISNVLQHRGRKPGLGVVLVGDDPASHVYVRNKQRAAEEVGFHSQIERLPAHASTDDVLRTVQMFNHDKHIDGFIVQLPLPSHVNAQRVLHAIDPNKDADGLHPVNLGAVLMGTPRVIPCTPRGCMMLIEQTGISIAGKKAVVIGRSAIVGRPMAALLIDAHATVTMCHSKTADLEAEISTADIVVAAVGRPRLVQGAWIKPGAVVIDVGINRDAQGLCGDVDFDSAQHRAGFITPVPGGVGPMTIAMLLRNTLEITLSAS